MISKNKKIIVRFLKAKLGRPPSREYKQSMAMQASPLPSPVKRKINVQLFTYLMGPFEKLKRYLKSEKLQ